MIRILCDVCGKDLFQDKRAWTIQMIEYKENKDTVTLHVCDEHQQVLGAALAQIINLNETKDSFIPVAKKSYGTD